MSDLPVVSIENVNRRYGAYQALDSINLSVARNEVLAILGPSGCGKTTLLNIIAGQDKPTSGVARVTGRTRMMYQRSGLFPWLTATENLLLAFGATATRESHEGELRELFALVRLEGSEERYPHELSGGMAQRLQLARALAGKGDVLLMDEPFSALDYFGRLRLRNELARILKATPRTVILVTHDLEEAAHLADRVVVMSPGPGRITFECRIEVERPRGVADLRVVAAMGRVAQEMKLEASPADGGETCTLADK